MNPFEAINDIYDEQVEKHDEKGYATLYKEATELFLGEAMEKEGFHAIDIEYLSGYFIFGSGTNSVVHFKVKECPKWVFAIWWGVKEESKRLVGQFFCQYEATVDKFKPSRSSYLTEIDVPLEEDLKQLKHAEIYDEEIDEFVETEYVQYYEGDMYRTFDFIHKHPLKAWGIDFYNYNYNYESPSMIGLFFKYIGYRIYDFKDKKILPWFDKRMVSLTKKLAKEVIDTFIDPDEYELTMEYRDYVDPAYQLNCKVPEDFEYEGLCQLFDTTDEYEASLSSKWDKAYRFYDWIAKKVLKIRWWCQIDKNVVFWKESHWDKDGNYIGPEEDEEA